MCAGILLFQPYDTVRRIQFQHTQIYTMKWKVEKNMQKQRMAAMGTNGRETKRCLGARKVLRIAGIGTTITKGNRCLFVLVACDTRWCHRRQMVLVFPYFLRKNIHIHDLCLTPRQHSTHQTHCKRLESIDILLDAKKESEIRQDHILKCAHFCLGKKV